MSILIFVLLKRQKVMKLIDCGNGHYPLADLCGMGSPDHNFFSACKDVEAYMTDSMKFSIDAIEGNVTEKQKMMIWRKYGISPKNYLFVQQSVAQVKTQASKLIAKATAEAVQLQREDRIAKTNAIIQAAYAQTDSDGNMPQGAVNEASLYLSQQVVDGLMSLEEAIDQMASLSAARMINEENEKQAEADEMATFYKWGSHYAVAIGTIGLCFKLDNSHFTVKDFWWNTLYKWVLFILFMSIYPLVTMGMSVMGNKVGINAGKGKQAIIDSLTSMKNSIEYDIQVGYQLKGELNKELGEITAKTETITFDTDFGDSNTYDEFIDKYYDEVNNATFNSKSAKKAALEKINEYREKNKYHSLFSKRTLKAIKDILVEKLPDGSDGDNLLPEYVDLNIWLKDAKGDDSYYLSPGAIMRVAVLGCQIMWEKNQIAYAIDMDEINEEDVNFIKKGFNKMTATFAHVPTMIMTMFCCLVLVFCAIFACIQYLMTILEYTIVVGIGAFFIPFILFDGTKELPKKLVPVLRDF